jgi:hypothetical protein
VPVLLPGVFFCAGVALVVSAVLSVGRQGFPNMCSHKWSTMNSMLRPACAWEWQAGQAAVVSLFGSYTVSAQQRFPSRLVASN